MLVPRLIITTHDFSAFEMMSEKSVKVSLGVLLKTSGADRSIRLQKAQEAKRLCLHTGTVLLLDDLELAALVNADGVRCEIDDDMHGRAKDVLGHEKLVGGTAHTIQDVATLFEEGMVDFVILKSFLDDGNAENILGKQKAQSIIDDARIMGYDIPILLEGGIDEGNIGDALSTGAYGIVTSQHSQIEVLQRALQDYPIR